jgi:predicted porin
MKKTLIALAAVAATTGAMAQATISGDVNFRYQNISGAASGNGKGFLVNDVHVRFSTSEDLGGGLTARAMYQIDGDAGVDGTGLRNDGVTLGLAGGFGSVTFSNIESPDYLPIDLVTAISAFANGTIADRITYQSPTMNGFNVVLTMQEGGTGGAGNDKTRQAQIYELNYAAGPLTANVGVLNVNKTTSVVSDGGTRARVGYNFGVANVSYGMVNTKNASGTKLKETGLSVSVPVNAALTVGVQYATAKTGTAAALKGTAINATYNLSKRTGIAFEQVNYDASSSLKDAKRTRVTLTHRF